MFSCAESYQRNRGEKLERGRGDQVAAKKRRRRSEGQQGQLEAGVDNIWNLGSLKVSVQDICACLPAVRHYQFKETEPTASRYPGRLAQLPETDGGSNDENARRQDGKHGRLEEDREIKVSSAALDRRTDGSIGVASTSKLHVVCGARSLCKASGGEQRKRNAS